MMLMRLPPLGESGGRWGKGGKEVYNDSVLSFDEFELLQVTAGHCGQTLKTNSRGLPPLGESRGRIGKTLAMVF